MAELINLAKTAGAMHEADHAYFIPFSLLFPEHLVITSIVPYMACVINSLIFFPLQHGFVEFSIRIWIVVFFSLIRSISYWSVL